MARVWLIGPILFAIFLPTAIFLKCRRKYRNKVPLIKDPAVFEAEKQAEMDKNNELRHRQEEDESKGTPVWFSRWINNGSLRHWVLYTHHTKYELRLPADMTSLEKLAKTVLSTSQYICQPTEWKKEEEIMDMRREYLEREGKPYTDADGYYICLIGWTDQSKEEVDVRFANVAKQLGNYNIYRNCQWFLKHFAQEILNKHPAADYNWFSKNIKTDYQRLLELPPTEQIVAYQHQMLRAAVNGSGNQLTVQEQNRIHQAIHRHMMESVAHATAHQHGAHHGAASQASNNIFLSTILPTQVLPGPAPAPMPC